MIRLSYQPLLQLHNGFTLTQDPNYNTGILASIFCFTVTKESTMRDCDTLQIPVLTYGRLVLLKPVQSCLYPGYTLNYNFSI